LIFVRDLVVLVEANWQKLKALLVVDEW